MTDVLQEHVVVGFCYVYTNDSRIFTELDNPDEHMKQIVAVLETMSGRFRTAG